MILLVWFIKDKIDLLDDMYYKLYINDMCIICYSVVYPEQETCMNMFCLLKLSAAKNRTGYGHSMAMGWIWESTDA